MTWTRERWTRIEALFHEASLCDVAQRASFLAAACAGDGELRAEVERLLAADEVVDDELIDQGVAMALRGRDPLLDQRFGAFRLVERIADGGMGAVYRAVRVDGDFAQDVAVKVLRLGLSTAAMRERFARERQTLARLVHPHVARLLDGGTTEQGVPFFAMELIDGVPLDRFCDEHKANLRQRLSLFATICRAVQFAHQNLIVHLDLKPSNILVDGNGVPKLVDFGVAGLLEGIAEAPAAVAATRTRPLTPEYASPELLRGEPVNTAADVYSLGVVLYELLTGTRAFRPTRSDLDLMRTVCETDAVRPSATFSAGDSKQVDPATLETRAERRSASAAELSRALRGDLDRIVGKAMRKEPERRYASCLEFAEDVERYLHGFPVVAREAGFGYRAAKFVRRHVVAVLAGTAVVLALLGGIVSTLHMAHVARAESGHARIEAASSSNVAAFLGETFLSAQSLVEPGQRANILATITRKADQVRRQYRANEHLCANLLDALGQTCTAVGAFEMAEQLIREAEGIRQRYFGADSLECALSLASLGELCYKQGRFEEALAATRECYRLHRECAVGVHTDVARAANNLAAVERSVGNRQRARELHLEALALRRQGGDPVLVAESLNNLANSDPDLRAARDHLSEAARLRAEVLGADDPLTIQAEANLGSLAVRMGEFDAARASLQSAVEKSRRLGSAGADGLAASLRSLGYAQLRLGELDAADAAIDEALELDSRRLGPKHPRVAGILEVRASICEQRGSWPAAVSTWREVVDIRRVAFPAGHRQVALAQCRLGTALAKAGDNAAALGELRGSLASHEAMQPRDSEDIVDTQVHLALALEVARQLDAAEQMLLAAHALSTSDGGTAACVRQARAQLREFYQRRGRAEDAARYAGLESGHPGR